jgi:hypothetical protein
MRRGRGTLDDSQNRLRHHLRLGALPTGCLKLSEHFLLDRRIVLNGAWGPEPRPLFIEMRPYHAWLDKYDLEARVPHFEARSIGVGVHRCLGGSEIAMKW